jgi:hypothetical protein
LGDEVEEDKDIFFVKKKGQLKTFIPVPNTSESDAEKFIHGVFPEIFADGYLYGFREGAEEQARCVEEDYKALLEHKEQQEEKIKELEQLLTEEKDKQKTAAGYIANMKATLAAIMIVNRNLVDIRGEGKLTKVSFSPTVKNFVSTAKGFRKTKLDMVTELYSSTDASNIREAMKKAVIIKGN